MVTLAHAGVDRTAREVKTVVLDKKARRRSARLGAPSAPAGISNSYGGPSTGRSRRCRRTSGGLRSRPSPTLAKSSWCKSARSRRLQGDEGDRFLGLPTLLRPIVEAALETGMRRARSWASRWADVTCRRPVRDHATGGEHQDQQRTMRIGPVCKRLQVEPRQASKAGIRGRNQEHQSTRILSKCRRSLMCFGLLSHRSVLGRRNPPAHVPIDDTFGYCEPR